jgi:phage tail sheath gpL-like
MISFNNIPTTKRTPGALVEIDNSRALKGLFANPHKALILCMKETDGSAANAALMAITSDNLADGYFGDGSIGARMCRTFKKNNPNTELYAMALSGGTVRASAYLSFGGSVTAAGAYVYLLIGGEKVYSPVTSGWSAIDVNSAVASDVNANANLCCVASVSAAGGFRLLAKGSTVLANQFDVRMNFYDGQSTPPGITYVLSTFAGGAGSPDVDDAWTVIDDIQFQHIINPFNDTTNLAAMATELDARFGPEVDKQGHCWTAYRGALASGAALGNSFNSPHITLIPFYESPTNPDEWSAAWGAVAASKLNDDPGRPLQYLALKNVIAPRDTTRWTDAERNTLLYDGCATFFVDASGNVMIERSITTYKTNAAGSLDASYLDVETLFILMEIRYQFKATMLTRFISQRYKLADDTFPVQAGMMVATRKTIQQEIISLFTKLHQKGLIENIEDFITNLIVERNADDVNRIDVLLPPDLINQFRILAGQIQFIL